MFASIKKIFVEVMIAAGIIASPVSVQPPQEIPANLPQQVVTEEVSTSTVKEVLPSTSVNLNTNPIKSDGLDVSQVMIILDNPKPAVKAQNGACGDSNGDNFIDKPISNLCAIGEASNALETNGLYTWQCLGSDGGRDSQCRAYKTIDGMCGSIANTIVPESFDQSAMCSSGISSDIQTVNNQIGWNCLGQYGGKNASCYALKALRQADVYQTQVKASVGSVPASVNGLCGYAQGVGVSQPPTQGLCDKGSATPVKKLDTSYSWYCSGIEGGLAAKCSAPHIEPKTIQTCGSIRGQGIPCMGHP